MSRIALSLLAAAALALPAAAGPHPHAHPHLGTRVARPLPPTVGYSHASFYRHHHCWRWDGVRWVWVPLLSVRVGDVVWFDGTVGSWRVTAPPAPWGAGFSIAIEVRR